MSDYYKPLSKYYRDQLWAAPINVAVWGALCFIFPSLLFWWGLVGVAAGAAFWPLIFWHHYEYPLYVHRKNMLKKTDHER